MNTCTDSVVYLHVHWIYLEECKSQTVPNDIWGCETGWMTVVQNTALNSKSRSILQMSDLSFYHRWLYINLTRLCFVSELVEDQWVTLFESSVPSIGLQYEISSPCSIESLSRYTNIDTYSLSCEIWQRAFKHLVNKRSWEGCIDCMLRKIHEERRMLVFQLG